MSLPLFIARRIYGENDDRKKVSRPAIRIATIGVAIGLAVMIVTVAVVSGFKHSVREKVVGFGSHIKVVNVQSVGAGREYSACIDDSLMSALAAVKGVTHVERYTTTQGILKTDSDFLGVMLKGVGPEYDTRFLKENLTEGELPQFCDSATKYPLVISKTMSAKLRLKTGDKVYAYFIGDDDVRVRKFTIAAVYQTNMKRFDDAVCLTDLYVTQRLNGWRTDEHSGAELRVSDFSLLDSINRNVTHMLRDMRLDNAGNSLLAMTIEQSYPQVFQWLGLLDINVWIILALMIALAGFTMISGLLIIILERTQMIGVLKALGSRNSQIRRLFLWFAVFIIGRGLLWGNVIGLGIVLIQKYTGIVKLDPQTYYVSQAPMDLNLLHVVLLNIATLIISVLVLIGPSYLVSRIHPARSMRYE